MPLHNVSNFMHLLSGYRVVWLGGRLGSGKSAFAFRLAYELMLYRGFRYLFSNCNSVWNDLPGETVLRPSSRGIPQFLDAVFILDEAGQFLSSPSEAKEWLSYLRKINVVVILASNIPPHHTTRFLTVQRTLNMVRFGLPFWLYRWTLESINIDEQGMFLWRNPHEIFGIYDTDAFPDDAAELTNFLLRKVHEAARSAGYRQPNWQERAAALQAAGNAENVSGSQAPDPAFPVVGVEYAGGPASPSPVQAGDAAYTAMADLRGDIDGLIEAAKQTRKAAVSVYKRNGRKR